MGLFNRRKRRPGASPDALTRAAVARVRAEPGIERVEALDRDALAVDFIGHDGTRRIDLAGVRPTWEAASGFLRIEVLDTFMEHVGPDAPLVADASSGDEAAVADASLESSAEPVRAEAEAAPAPSHPDPAPSRATAAPDPAPPEADHRGSSSASDAAPAPTQAPEQAGAVPASDQASPAPADLPPEHASPAPHEAPTHDVHVGRHPPPDTKAWPVVPGVSAWLVDHMRGSGATVADLGSEEAAAAELGRCLAALTATDPGLQRIGVLRAWMVTAPAHRAAWLCAPEALLDAVRLRRALLVAPVIDELVVVDPDDAHSVQTILANTASIVDELPIPLHPAPLLVSEDGLRPWRPEEAGDLGALVERLDVREPLTD